MRSIVVGGIATHLFLAGAVGMCFPEEMARGLSPEAPAGAALLLQVLGRRRADPREEWVLAKTVGRA